MRAAPLLQTVAILVLMLGCKDGTAPRRTEPEHPGYASPVQLTLGGTVGEVRFNPGNTASGGQGAEIGGVRCIKGASDIAYHEHAHVSLFVNGKQIAIPAAIGVTQWKMDQSVGDGFVTGGSCFYGLHTHDATGIIHVEPPTQERLTLGQLFQLWGQPLSRTNAAGFAGDVTVYVDGVLHQGDLKAIPLFGKQEITLQVGSPLAPIPSYILPAGY